MKNKLFIPFTIVASVFILSASCNQSQSKIDKMSKIIEQCYQNKDNLTQSDLDKMELKMEELEKDLELNRNNYTDEQVKEIGRLQGRYAAILVKKGINDFQESVKDLNNQMEGFMEGIKDSTNNK
ncbi:MAG: hypothetical protein ACK48W_04185 [Bacteroidota bacterium]|jgi:hypothetical protein